MNININISDSSESQSVNLLTNVINCLQTEKIKLEEKSNALEQGKHEADVKFAELNEKYNALKQEKKDADVKFAELNERYNALEQEKKDADVKFAELNERYNALEQEKKDADAELAELNEKYNRERIAVLIESIKQVSFMLRISLNSDIDTKWTEYIRDIIAGIDNFVHEVKTIDDVKLKIVSKNGWLSKIASIRWWSEADSVKDLLPSIFQNGSNFYHSFCNLQHKMNEFGIGIQIPSCDFSNKIDNYKVDYDEDTIVKRLFPQYSPGQFVLCEINYVSHNGNVGKCIGYAVN